MTATITGKDATMPTPTAERLFRAGDGTLAAHRIAYGDLPGSAGLLRAIADSGLTGRGGSGFPTTRKIAAVKDARHPVVVANGSEGEPASRKDATLLTYAPHLILDGLEILGEALGATMHLVTTADRIDAIRSRIAERGADVTVTEVPERFISGEESAVVAAINGRAAVPADRLTRVWQRGVNGRPTVVLNVETLAHIALIARHGADWFRAVGEAEDPGTFLATIAPTPQTGDGSPRVYELARGTHLGAFLEEAGNGCPRAVLVGGVPRHLGGRRRPPPCPPLTARARALGRNARRRCADADRPSVRSARDSTHPRISSRRGCGAVRTVHQRLACSGASVPSAGQRPRR